jgi:Na+/H+-dicarboxylate symporter
MTGAGRTPSLTLQIAAGLVAGLALGLVASAGGWPALARFAAGLEPVGTVWINLIRMVVIPLVVAALVSGVAGLGGAGRLGRLGVRTLAFFWGTTLLAIALGLVLALVAMPLAPLTADTAAALKSAAAASTADAMRNIPRTPGVAEFFVNLIPTNPIKAAADGALLPVIAPASALGFSTTSSMAALPAMMDIAVRELRISPPVASFVLPLGATINRPATGLYHVVAAVFIATLYGVPLGAVKLAVVASTAFLMTLSVPAVPSGNLLTLAPVLLAAGLPLEGIGLLFGVDRIPDMFRTGTNVTGHMVAAAVVARGEGEEVMT